MKIASSNVLMSSSHKSEVSASISESLTITGSRDLEQAAQKTTADVVRITKAQLSSTNPVQSAKSTEDVPFEISDEDMLKIRLIEQFMRQLTGKDFKIRIPDKLITENGGAVQANGSVAAQGSQGLGWGLIYSKTVATTQSEATVFSATAQLTTEDGREISAQISLALARSTARMQNTTIRFGDAKAVDPLVVNFAAASASVSANKFTFDLNADGKTEQISFVGPGSGFLALDRNKDGLINNGDELFGPSSGNGFADLAKFDGDNNLWIDENDNIYDRLQIWTKDENGADRLFALAAKGIGAIYLGNVATPFTLENADAIDATIQRTGIFIREDGTAGTIQHVDMQA